MLLLLIVYILVFIHQKCVLCVSCCFSLTHTVKLFISWPSGIFFNILSDIFPKKKKKKEEREISFLYVEYT